jgi:competence protein ComEC
VALPLVLLACACLGALRLDAARAAPGPGHVAELNDRGACTFRGWIAAEPDKRDRGVYYHVDVEAVRAGELWRPSHGRVLVQAPRFPVHAYGATVLVKGELETPPVFDTFDYREWLAHKGVHSVARRAAVSTLTCCRGSWLRRGLLLVKDRARQSLAASLPEPESALATGILLGDARGIPQKVDDAFRATNTTHVIAISGSNVAVLVGLLTVVLVPLVGRRPAVPVTVAVLALYTALVGADAAVVRAAVMGVVMVVGVWVGRPGHAVTALMLSAGAMTVYRPGYLWDLGFQLSFAATIGLLAFVGPLSTGCAELVACSTADVDTPRGKVPPPGPRSSVLWSITNEAVLVTLAAQVTTWPLIAHQVGQVSIAGLAANFVIVPVQSAVMVLGGATAVAGAAWVPAGKVVGAVAWIPLAFTIRVVETAARLPAASIEWRMPGEAVAAYYVVVVALAMPRCRSSVRAAVSDPRALTRAVRRGSATRWLRLVEAVERTAPRGAGAPAVQPELPPSPRPPHRALVALIAAAARGCRRASTGRLGWVPASAAGVAALLFWIGAAAQPDGLTHLHVLDVGQGDALLVVTPNGRRMLVDGGPSPSAVLDGLGRLLAPWDRRIDVVVLTHPDDDHVAGLPAVLARYDVGLIVHAPQDVASAGAAAWLDGVGREGADIAAVSSGARLTLDDQAGVVADVLWPSRQLVSGTGADVNNNSVVLRLAVGHVAMLLTGDIEEVVESRLVHSDADLEAAVLKVAHHGSSTSSSARFVAAVEPRVAVISVGADNSFGHPAPATLVTLGAVPAYRTDVGGPIDVMTDGRDVWVRQGRAR